MKTVGYLLMVLLLIRKNLAQETETLQNSENREILETWRNKEITEEILIETTITKIELEAVKEDNKKYSVENVEPEITTETVKQTNLEEEVTTKSEAVEELEVTTETVIKRNEGKEVTTELEAMEKVTNKYSGKTMEPEATTEIATKTNEVKEVTRKNVTMDSKVILEQQQVLNRSIKIDNEQVQTIVEITMPAANTREETNVTNEAKDIEDISEKFSNAETPTTTPMECELKTKPLITLEDYALKQMNFILDYLLIEIQEFIAKVLQATVNSVFQRDHLKRYAESLNHLLNHDADSQYSNEVIENSKVITHDELYEEIVNKLSFLKSRPSKYLQKLLPPDWVTEFRNKRAEMAIWLDKASQHMHQEFQRYISEEEDHIKYQYFNEAFDDISRATEIHHKLAVLTDLVKVVKNKKQITFMDLYMQT